jgi:hypothetical protein
MKKVSRRELMAGAALGGALFAGVQPARAFSEVQAPVKARLMHENACGATVSHKELVAEVERVLGDKYTEEEKRQVVANLTCPICGCPLGGLA